MEGGQVGSEGASGTNDYLTKTERHLYAGVNSFKDGGVGFTNSFAGMANSYRRRRSGRKHVHKTAGTEFR